MDMYASSCCEVAFHFDMRPMDRRSGADRGTKANIRSALLEVVAMVVVVAICNLRCALHFEVCADGSCNVAVTYLFASLVIGSSDIRQRFDRNHSLASGLILMKSMMDYVSLGAIRSEIFSRSFYLKIFRHEDECCGVHSRPISA